MHIYIYIYIYIPSNPSHSGVLKYMVLILYRYFRQLIST